MNTIKLKRIFETIRNKPKFTKSYEKVDPSLRRHLKDYPNMNFRRNQIIDVEHRLKTKNVDFSKGPMKRHLDIRKYRVPLKIREVE